MQSKMTSLEQELHHLSHSHLSASSDSGAATAGSGPRFKTPMQLMHETSQSFAHLEEKLLRAGLDGTEDDAVGRVMPKEATQYTASPATSAKEWKEITSHNAQIVDEMKRLQGRYQVQAGSEQ
jgi:hypothetical protein